MTLETVGVSPALLRVLLSLHPYPRYGVAAATARFGKGKMPSQLNESELRAIFMESIEFGLSNFRMETEDDPAFQTTLRYKPISLKRLSENASLVQGSLAVQGKYLYPSVVTSDGTAKNTFNEALSIFDSLQKGESLLKPIEMKRSFAPIMGEVNNGKGEKQNLKASLFEAAASCVATLTPDKPAALVGGKNTVILPDLAIDPLYEFVRVFNLFKFKGWGTTQPYERLIIQDTKRPESSKKPAAKPNAKVVIRSEYRRPPLHDGNYPEAPREAAFGAVGLLAAIGYWSLRADEQDKQLARHVLDSLPDTPLYILSLDGVAQACFVHPIVEMAKSGSLRDLIREFWRDVRPYALYEKATLTYTDHEDYAFKHLIRATSRFLQQFDTPSFKDFLATRAEYPPLTHLLFKEYFMQSEPGLGVPSEIVSSARALGQWINRAVYSIAREDTLPSNTTERDTLLAMAKQTPLPKSYQDWQTNLRKVKAKTLVEIESLIFSAKEPAEMGGRILRTIGQASSYDAPTEALAFLDYANTKDLLPFKTAQYLLLTYMRIKAPPTTPGAPVAATTSENESDDPPTSLDDELAGLSTSAK